MNEEILKKMNKNLDVIIQVITPWHAIGAKAILLYFREKGFEVDGTILIQKHAEAGHMVSSEEFQDDDVNVIYTEFEMPPKNIFKRIKRESDIKKACKDYLDRETNFDSVIAAPWHVNKNKILQYSNEGKNYFSIVFDEGLATYINNDTSSLLSYEKSLKSNGKLEYFTLFSKSGESLEDNKEIQNLYADAIRINAERREELSTINLENSVVINTQTFVNDGQISEQEELRLLKLVTDECGKKDIKVYLKPHPRDDKLDRFKELNVELLSYTDVPQEEMFAKSAPRAVVGFTTTSLVTANKLFGIKSISLNKLVGEEVGSDMRRDMENFEKYFGDGVQIVESEEELIQSL